MNAVDPRSGDRPHAAKYLLLFQAASARRALLFGGDHRYLAELIDDGLMLDDLIRAGTLCPAPSDLSMDTVVPPPPDPQSAAIQCYTLG